jgi:hypothetical protein
MSANEKTRPRVTGLRRREDTTLRLGGVGDNFHTTWAADDRQYTAVDDGSGWWEEPVPYFFNSRIWAITGGPEGAVFEDVPGYPKLDGYSPIPAYYSFGTLAVGEHIYQFLGTNERHADDLLFVGAKLIYSADIGVTWHNQDGSPVHWEGWDERDRDTMAFWREPQYSFSVLSLLQMGKAYELNRDGYVYAYALNGLIDGEINELVLFRVPKDHVLERARYEYFVALRADGGARWTRDIARHGVVHTFPLGFATPHAHTWVPSVVYNESLGIYMMASFGMEWGPPGAGRAPRPSYLGVWTAPAPWGPWTQIHEEQPWYPTGDPAERAYEAQIPAKWIAEDGCSFWLVWSDFQGDPGPDGREMPYYAMNAQRVDLIIE